MQQFSAAVPTDEGDVRMIPIAFNDASSPRKPRKSATDEDKISYKELMKQKTLNNVAISALTSLPQDRRVRLDVTPKLHVLVDGRYTNRRVLTKRIRRGNTRMWLSIWRTAVHWTLTLPDRSSSITSGTMASPIQVYWMHRTHRS